MRDDFGFPLALIFGELIDIDRPEDKEDEKKRLQK